MKEYKKTNETSLLEENIAPPKFLIKENKETKQYEKSLPEDPREVKRLEFLEKEKQKQLEIEQERQKKLDEDKKAVENLQIPVFFNNNKKINEDVNVQSNLTKDINVYYRIFN